MVVLLLDQGILADEGFVVAVFDMAIWFIESMDRMSWFMGLLGAVWLKCDLLSLVELLFGFAVSEVFDVAAADAEYSGEKGDAKNR